MSPRKASPKKARGPVGLGSVFQRASDRTWVAAVRVPQETGGSKIIRAYARSREDAEAKRLDLLTARRDGGLRGTPRQTVRAYLLDWLRVAPLTRSPNTMRGYTSILTKHVLPALGDLALDELAPRHVDALLVSLADRHYSPRTQRDVRADLAAALEQAVERQIIPRNPARLSKPPRLPSLEPRFLTRDEATRLLGVVTDHPIGALFTVCLAIGLRFGEAAGLRWTDLTLDGILPELRVRMNLQPAAKGSANRYELREPKAKSRRTLTLPQFAVTALRKRRRIQDQQRAAAGPSWTDRWGLVFTSDRGYPLDRKNVWRCWKRLLKLANIPDARLHDLRHSCVSLLAAQGLSIKELSELLGHSSIRVTADVYVHLYAEARGQAAETMEALFGGR